MSDFEDYDEDDYLSLDDVVEDEQYDDISNNDWSDSLDDMDSGEWGDQYGYSDEELGEDEVDPWDLN